MTDPALPPESDWFPIRIASVPSAGAYLFQEVWLGPDALIADRVGGRSNTTNDLAYAIDGSVFTAASAGTPVQAMARRAPGAGGVLWELRGASAAEKKTDSATTPSIDPLNVPGSSNVFTETYAQSGRWLYFSQGNWAGSGPFDFTVGLGVWPSAYATPAAARAAGKLRLKSPQQFSVSGAGNFTGGFAIVGMTTGVLVEADFPVSVCPLEFVNSGTVTVLATSFFARH